MGIKSFLLNIYDKQYKLLLILSFVLLFACIGVLFHHKAVTGEFVSKGVSLKGGLTMTIPTAQANVDEIQTAMLLRFPHADVSVRSFTEAGQMKGIIIEASDVTEDELIGALREHGFSMQPGTFSSEVMGSSLGESFYRQTLIAIAVAFLFMSIVVFITFRVPMPSFYIILCAISDIISVLAVIDLLGIKLSTAGVAALLMLIGYSVDTDILLTTKVLRGKTGTVFQRMTGTMQTGLLMSLTSFAATTVGHIVVQSDVVKQIMLIISIGMIFDIIYTWLQNAGILRWYLERKAAKHGEHHG